VGPDEEHWGEEREPIEQWAKPIIARGKRLAAFRCGGENFRYDIAVLVFKPASTGPRT
jgi:hypothetical protein